MFLPTCFLGCDSNNKTTYCSTRCSVRKRQLTCYLTCFQQNVQHVEAEKDIANISRLKKQLPTFCATSTCYCNLMRPHVTQLVANIMLNMLKFRKLLLTCCSLARCCQFVAQLVAALETCCQRVTKHVYNTMFNMLKLRMMLPAFCGVGSSCQLVAQHQHVTVT